MAGYVNPNGETGYGLTLGYAAPSAAPATNTYTFLATIMSVTPPGSDVPKADATLLTSLCKVSNPGVPELTASAKVRCDSGEAGHRTIRMETWSAPVPQHDWQIKDTNGATVSWTGYCNSFKDDERTTDESRTATMELAINTVPVYTPPPSS